MASPYCQQSLTTIGRLLIVAGIMLGVFAVTSAPAFADAPAPDTATANYEVRFLEGMIPATT